MQILSDKLYDMSAITNNDDVAKADLEPTLNF